MRRVTLYAALVLCVPAMLLAADWPQFLGPSRNGISSERGINKAWKSKPPRQLWRVPMSDNGYAGPAVAGGKVYIIDHQGSNDVVRALDLRTGRDVWKFPYADTGQNNYGFARSTPTVEGSRVYTLSRLGKLHCLDAAKGTKIWAVDIKASRPGWDLAASPFIDGSKIIMVPGAAGATVTALNKANGQTLWKCNAGDKPGYATPVVATINGKRQYVVFCAKKLIGVDAANGKLLWSFPWTTQYDVNAASPIVIGNSVFISSGYGHGCAMVDISGSSARARWQNRDLAMQFSSPVYTAGAIFGCSDNGFLVCMDPKSGRVIWKQSGWPQGGIAVVDGALVVMNGNSGEVGLVAATTAGYKEMGRFRPLGSQSWTAPVVANGNLILRNKTALACYSLK